MKIENSEIAEAIYLLDRTRTWDEFITSPDSSSYKVQDCFLQRVAKKILANHGFLTPGKATIKFHTDVCYRILKNHVKREEIKNYFNTIKFSVDNDNSSSSESLISTEESDLDNRDASLNQNTALTDNDPNFQDWSENSNSSSEVECTKANNDAQDLDNNVDTNLSSLSSTNSSGINYDPNYRDNNESPKSSIEINETGTNNSKVANFSHVSESSTPHSNTDSKRPEENIENITRTNLPSLLVPKCFWEKYWDQENMTMRNGWTDSFNSIFEKQKEYKSCVLTFLYKKCYPPTKKKNNVYFSAKAKCQNTLCTVFTFECLTPIQEPYDDYEVKVSVDGPICHNISESHRRQCRGETRKNIAQELEKEKPDVVKCKMLNMKDPEAFKSGNLNNAYSSTVLQKISSEKNRVFSISKDIINEILDLSALYDLEWPHKLFPGYIQSFNVRPFNIILFTVPQLKYLISLPHPIFLHLDSTGSIFAPVRNAKKIFYYALTTPGIKSLEFGPLPLAEFISSDQTAHQIAIFLSTVNDHLRRLSQKKLFINKVETDFSLALMHGVTMGFNNLSLKAYIDMTYKIDTSNDNDSVLDFTMIHICSTHLSGTVRRYLKTIKTTRSIEKLVFYWISRLVHCTTLDEADEIFKLGCEVFGCEWRNDNLSNLVDEIMKFETRNIFNLQEENIEDDEEDKKTEDCNSECDSKCSQGDLSFSEDENDDLELDEEDNKKKSSDSDSENERKQKKADEKKLRHGSPYHIRFEKIYKKIKENDTQVNKPKKNEYCLLSFFSYVLEHLMPFFSIWSATVLHKIMKSGRRYLRYSNATAETFFNIVKNIYLKGEKNISVTRFIKKMLDIIKAKLLEREKSLLTERQKKNRSLKRKQCEEKEDESIYEDDWALASESWDRSKRRPTYFQQKRYKRAVSVESLNLINRKNSQTYKALFNHKIDYPTKFPELFKIMYGINVNKDSFETLNVNEELDDNIINAAFLLLQDYARLNKFNILVMESFLSTGFIEEGILKPGFKNWAKTVKIQNYGVWMAPIYNNRHWTLLIAVKAHKIILYLDSLWNCRQIPKNLIDGFFMLISNYWSDDDNNKANPLEWTVVKPNDVPVQDTEKNIINNCGVHAICWGHCIATSSYCPFTEADMITARKGIAVMLAKNKNLERKKYSNTHHRRIYFEDEGTSENITHVQLKKSNQPPLQSQSTFEYCASLRTLIAKEQIYSTRSNP